MRLQQRILSMRQGLVLRDRLRRWRIGCGRCVLSKGSCGFKLQVCRVLRGWKGSAVDGDDSVVEISFLVHSFATLQKQWSGLGTPLLTMKTMSQSCRPHHEVAP